MVGDMDRTEAWVTLDLIPNIGPVSVKKLIEIFKSPENILSVPVARIKETGILNAGQLRSFSRGPDKEAVGKALSALKEHEASAIPIDDARYPEILRQIEDPPFLLYVKGSLEEIEPSVAVVGTRAPSHYGRETAYSLARNLSMKGIVIVSGLARGIDTAAHTGALEGEANTIAVLGTGIDITYPPENAGLAERIARKGAVITEYPPGTNPDAGNFPRRNRIISGLSAGVIVVEAAYRSGALITSRFAAEQGKTVMAVPGQVTNIRAQGPHHLIRQGAALVRDADDVIAEIAPQIKRIIGGAETGGQPDDEIVGLIGGDPLSIEDIAHELDLDIIETTKRVSILELTGKIVRIEGNRFMARSINE